LLLIGYLIFKSTFLPKALGVLVAFAGVNWLTFISPAFADRLSPFNLVPGLIGEGALTLWLLFKGINPQRSEPAGHRCRPSVIVSSNDARIHPRPNPPAAP